MTVWVHTASDAVGYQWYAVTDTVRALDDLDAPPGWDTVKSVIRPGRICLAIAREAGATTVVVSGVTSRRTRWDRPVHDTFLLREPDASPVTRGVLDAVLSDDTATFTMLSDAIGDDLAVDNHLVQQALHALRRRRPAPGTAPIPDGVFRDTPRAREQLRARSGDLLGETGLLVAVTFGAVPSTLTAARVALTTHRDAPEVGEVVHERTEDLADRAGCLRGWLWPGRRRAPR